MKHARSIYRTKSVMQEMHKFHVNCVGNLNYELVVGCLKEVIVSRKLAKNAVLAIWCTSSCMKLNFDQTCGKHTCFCVEGLRSSLGFLTRGPRLCSYSLDRSLFFNSFWQQLYYSTNSTSQHSELNNQIVDVCGLADHETLPLHILSLKLWTIE